MRLQEIMDIIEKNLFYLKAKVLEKGKKTILQSDKMIWKRCGKFRIELLNLLE